MSAISNGNGNGTRAKKQLLLNAFVESCSGHQSPGLWQHPDDESSDFNDIHHWVRLAKLLEDAKFHGIFIADVLGGYDVYQGPRNLTAAIKSGAQWPVNEPLSIVPAMAAATKNLGFGVTVATTKPYHLARRLSTVDHLTGGRLGWNIVTGYLDSAARNLGATEQPEHDERYNIAEEYLRVMYKLWQSSWRDDAVVLNRKTGVYTDPELVREVNHEGKYYKVPGPHICQPSPQRTPVLMQAGTSKAGKAFASQHAECIFVAGHSPAVVAKNIADIRQQASEKFGRDPQSVKFLALICPVIGRTEEEANKKFEDLQRYGDIDGALALFGGWTGIDLSQYEDDQELRHVESNAIRSAVEGWSKSSPSVKRWTKHTVAKHITIGGLGATAVGTPEQVADEFERWIDEADVDGFNIAYAIKPGSFVDVIELLLPELRKRGLFHNEYAVDGGTYRENIYATKGQKVPRKDHAAYRYQWQAGVAKDQHEIPQEEHNGGVSVSNGNGHSTSNKASSKRAAETEPEKAEQEARRKSARTTA
ncbi:putative xenobiotic compound monooxygenase [Venturia nashicola]|nr:putative xenobiotic compound monooxygenase [Venturia nashicola]